MKEILIALAADGLLLALEQSAGIEEDQ